MATFTVVKLLDIYKGYTLYKDQFRIVTDKRYVRLREHETDQLIRIDSILLPNKDYSTYLKIDENGFLVQKPNIDDPDLKIAFLGGSTTNCSYVDEVNRFPNIIQRKIEDSLLLKTNIYNTSIDGANTLHTLNVFINKVLLQEPDYAIMMHNINDLSVLMHEDTYWNNHFSRSLLMDKQIFKYMLPNYEDHMFPNLATVWDLTRNIYPQHEFSDGHKININKKIEIAKKQYRSALLSFVRVAKAWNIQPVLMTQVNEKGENKALIKAHSYFNEIIREIAREEEIVCIDLAAKFGSRDDLFYDTMHFHDNGSIEVGDYIFQELKPILEKREIHKTK